MPRVARKYIQSNLIHIVTEGIKKEFIFYQDKYKNEYILLLKKYINEMSNLKLISYCVMNNHAHILIYIENIEEVSMLMRKINTAYANYYNKNEERVGYVFANRYYSQSIKNEAHLLTCIQYIHQNPVKAGLANLPNEYKFSSFKDFCENKLDRKIAKIIFGTENYLLEFNKLKIDNDVEIIEKNTRKIVGYVKDTQLELEFLEENPIAERLLVLLYYDGYYFANHRKVIKIEDCKFSDNFVKAYLAIEGEEKAYSWFVEEAEKYKI